jgi:hypothetical protein
MRRFVVLAIATSLPAGCGTDGSDRPRVAVCPPVVDYEAELQERAADELVVLPERSAIAEMLADYGVTRDQARTCSGP